MSYWRKIFLQTEPQGSLMLHCKVLHQEHCKQKEKQWATATCNVCMKSQVGTWGFGPQKPLCALDIREHLRQAAD